ncbi:hypothetical protein SAMN04488057_101370 [Cyclobacterium lianum]|uniref:Uncharacterized protein n=1 Tax=Cyclobacterium lianum TaxID=388280 RepID=A0A1M7IKV0_9BACT|nr:hypothetical protein [Cyclobacterium lianum]SHM41238.1 hypothetical protein SAMN04488057_101370 [Cyclobacterium lianum]
MKTHKIVPILIVAVLLGSQINVLAQESKNEYLEKSRRQKTAGYIMAGGGLAMVAAGSIMFSENFILFGASNAEERATGMGVAMAVVGGIATIGSIPMLISAANNKRKATQMSFKPLPTSVPGYAGGIPSHIPSLTLTIPL